MSYVGSAGMNETSRGSERVIEYIMSHIGSAGVRGRRVREGRG